MNCKEKLIPVFLCPDNKAMNREMMPMDQITRIRIHCRSCVLINQRVSHSLHICHTDIYFTQLLFLNVPKRKPSPKKAACRNSRRQAPSQRRLFPFDRFVEASDPENYHINTHKTKIAIRIVLLKKERMTPRIFASTKSGGNADASEWLQDNVSTFAIPKTIAQYCLANSSRFFLENRCSEFSDQTRSFLRLADAHIEFIILVGKQSFIKPPI